jgi:hypothetical protein
MAMAIHGAKILSENIISHFDNRQFVEENYLKAWKDTFSQRLWVGRNVQKLFGNEIISEIALSSLKNIRPLLGAIMKATHGDIF